MLGTATWRANPDWGAELGYDARGPGVVNRRALEFAEEFALRPAGDAPVLIEAPARSPRRRLRAVVADDGAEAERYHATQLRTLADTAADLACALTITYADEAIGIVVRPRLPGSPS